MGVCKKATLLLRARAQDQASTNLFGEWSVPAEYSVDAVDLEADRLLDAWEMQYFSTLTYGPNDDPDRDGMTNLAEYLAGTNPNDPNSKLAVKLHVTGPNAMVTW